MGDQSLYIPHSSLDTLPVRISFIKIWDENNLLTPFLEDGVREEKDQYFITSQLIINGNAITQPKPMKIMKRNPIHEDNIVFPVNYKDLTYNSLIAITIYSPGKTYDENSPLGSTTIPLFDENLKLREGKHNLVIWPGIQPDISFDSKTPGLVQDKNIQSMNFCTQKIAQIDTQEVTENVALSNLRLKLLYCYKTIPAAFLEISLPRFPKPILFEDVEYQFDDTQILSMGGGCPINLYSQRDQPIQIKNQSFHQKSFIPLNSFSDCQYVNDFNQDLKRSDPIQEMSLLLFRDDVDSENLKPSRNEIEVMSRLIKLPLLAEMKGNQRALFYRYRYYFVKTQTQFAAALPRFLASIDWSDHDERDEAIKILKKWGPIEIEDALYLLSSQTVANDLFGNRKTKKPHPQMIEIRNFAVRSLERFSDEEIENVLLQLVQALKYESTNGGSALETFLYKRAKVNRNLATLLYWFLNVEQDPGPQGGRGLVTDWYRNLYENYCSMIERENKEIWKIISSQIRFREKLQKLCAHIRPLGDKSTKQTALRSKLAESDFQDPDQLPSHPSCLNTNIILQKAIPAETNIFSSAMAPIKFKFESITTEKQPRNYEIIFKNGDDLRQDQLVMQVFQLMDQLLKQVNQDMKLLPYKILACSKSDGFLEFVTSSRTVQDILEKQSISQYLQSKSNEIDNPFFWELLSNDRQNKDVPVTKAMVQELIDENKNQPYGINKQIMNNYVLSCAGYCVLTYFLGIGDRHLENLMINNEGKMFHIDFGFILGKDPKPYPPPFKLCQPMVEGLGGMQSEFYFLFKQKCIDVYIYLRKHAKLIITLFQLMTDAGIKDFQPKDSHRALEALEEKFRLEDSDENAEIHFLGIVEESVKSFFSAYTDTIHRWASYWRK